MGQVLREAWLKAALLTTQGDELQEKDMRQVQVLEYKKSTSLCVFSDGFNTVEGSLHPAGFDDECGVENDPQLIVGSLINCKRAQFRLMNNSLGFKLDVLGFEYVGGNSTAHKSPTDLNACPKVRKLIEEYIHEFGIGCITATQQQRLDTMAVEGEEEELREEDALAPTQERMTQSRKRSYGAGDCEVVDDLELEDEYEEEDDEGSHVHMDSSGGYDHAAVLDEISAESVHEAPVGSSTRTCKAGLQPESQIDDSLEQVDSQQLGLRDSQGQLESAIVPSEANEDLDASQSSYTEAQMTQLEPQSQSQPAALRMPLMGGLSARNRNSEGPCTQYFLETQSQELDVEEDVEEDDMCVERGAGSTGRKERSENGDMQAMSEGDQSITRNSPRASQSQDEPCKGEKETTRKMGKEGLSEKGSQDSSDCSQVPEDNTTKSLVARKFDQFDAIDDDDVDETETQLEHPSLVTSQDSNEGGDGTSCLCLEDVVGGAAAQMRAEEAYGMNWAGCMHSDALDNISDYIKKLECSMNRIFMEQQLCSPADQRRRSRVRLQHLDSEHLRLCIKKRRIQPVSAEAEWGKYYALSSRVRPSVGSA